VECVSLCADAKQNEMDVIHHFIKNMGVKKARIIKTEIFEAPPKAVLTLTPRTPTRQHSQHMPSHHLKLWAKKQPNSETDFDVFYELGAVAPNKKSFKQATIERLEKINPISFKPRPS